MRPLTNIIATVAQSSARRGLRSANTAAYVKPRTRMKSGKRGFRFASPDTWNSLPSHPFLLLILQLSNLNLKLNLLDKCSTTDGEHFIDDPGQLCGAAL